MNTLYWQTALLMAAAYLIGAIVACLLRKLVAPRRRADVYAKTAAASGPAATNISRRIGEHDQKPQPSPEPVRESVADLTSEPPARREYTEQVIEPAPQRVPMSHSELSGPGRSLSEEISSSEKAARFERTLSGPVEEKHAPAEKKPSAISQTTSIAAAVAAAGAVAGAASKALAKADNEKHGDDAQEPVSETGAGSADRIVVEPIVERPRAEGTSTGEEVKSVAPIAPAAEGVSAGRDDLQNISRIDAAIEQELNEAGVTQYAQIAAWNASDVAQVNAHFGVRGRVQKENWIEQAQILGAGGQTIYSRGRQQTAKITTLETPESAPASEAEASSTSPQETNPASDAISRSTQNDQTSQVSTTTAKPVEDRDSEPGGETPDGSATATAVASAAAAAAAAVAALRGDNRPDSADESEHSTIRSDTQLANEQEAGQVEGADLSPSRTDEEAGNAGPSTVRTESKIPEHVERVSEASGEVVSRALDTVEKRTQRTDSDRTGYSRHQSNVPDAPLSVSRQQEQEPGDPREPGESPVSGEHRLERTARTRREDVISRSTSERSPREPRSYARRSHREGRTGSDIGSMRSVRSAAYRQEAHKREERRKGGAHSGGDVRTSTTMATTKRVVSTEADDLKRIRGIGVLIERKLNSLGVVSYEQIANWTAEDVAEISRKLDFKGRIERENWVEQARILAAGGYTEFSSRVDRGEVNSSKDKS